MSISLDQPERSQKFATLAVSPASHPRSFPHISRHPQGTSLSHSGLVSLIRKKNKVQILLHLDVKEFLDCSYSQNLQGMVILDPQE